MSDDLRTRIAAAIDRRYNDEAIGHTYEVCLHAADAVIAELGLRQEWAPADVLDDDYVDPDTQWTYDRRSDAEMLANIFDQAVASRYVTEWETDD